MKPGLLVWFLHQSHPLSIRRVLILEKYKRNEQWWKAIDPKTGTNDSCVFTSECTPLTPNEVFEYVMQAKKW